MTQDKKEAQRRYQKKYLEKNKEKIAQYTAEYYQKNKKAILKHKADTAYLPTIMLRNSKNRANTIGREHNITLEDIVIPDVCPLLGIPLHKGDGKLCGNSPSLDRFDNTKGYIKGNVWVISHKANSMKGGASFEEFQAMYYAWRDHTHREL